MVFSHLKGAKKFKVRLNSLRNCSVGLLLLYTELTLFCIELPENCIYLNQLELNNFFMYLIKIVNVHGPAFEKFDEILITLSTK